MHTHVLIKYFDNWADEFSVEGYELFTKEEWERIDADIANHFVQFGSYEFYFGTNESMDYGSEEELRNTLVVEYLTEQEVATTFLYLPKQLGIVPCFDDLYQNEEC